MLKEYIEDVKKAEYEINQSSLLFLHANDCLLLAIIAPRLGQMRCSLHVNL